MATNSNKLKINFRCITLIHAILQTIVNNFVISQHFIKNNSLKMRIGVNTRFLLSSKMEGFGWYTFEVVKRLVEQHPEHEFIFFFDRKYDERFIFGPNVKPVVLFPPTRSVLLIISWFECALPRALKK